MTLASLKTVALAVAATSMITSAANAGVLAGWDVGPIVAADNWGASPYAPTTTDANVSVVGFTRNWSTGSGTPAAGAWGGNNFGTLSNLNDSLSAGRYATFSLTADAGYELSLDSIDAYNIRRSSSGPTTGQWQYQVGSGSFVNLGSEITWGSNTSSTGNNQAAIDLSGISALQDVAAGTTVTFRIAVWGTSTTSGTWYINDPQKDADNDFVIVGTTNLVPEPASLGLLGIAGLSLARRRRTR